MKKRLLFSWAVAMMIPFCFAGGCRRAEPELPRNDEAAVRTESEEAVTVTGIESTVKDSAGRTLWTVKASSGSGRVVEKRVSLQDVECVLYAGGLPMWRCSAKKLVAEEPTKRVRFIGDVRGKSMDGTRSFRMPEAAWTIGNGRITGGPGVSFRMGGVIMNGERLIASTDEQWGKVVGNVTGRVVSPPLATGGFGSGAKAR